MVTLKIEGTPRNEVGKAATKADRRAGLIPCAMYGSSNDTVHFTVTFNQIRELIYTPDFKLAEITVDGQGYQCILKEVQFDPVTDAITHIDFLQLVNGRTIKVEVPLRFEGAAPGVRSGGKFIQKVRKVKIKTKPEFLVDELIANVSRMRLGQSLRIKDIAPIQGVEVLNPPALPIATITIPRGLKGAAIVEEEPIEEAAAE